MSEFTPEQWVEALESGKYEHLQGRLGLYQSDGAPTKACCIGVLMDAAGKASSEQGELVVWDGTWPMAFMPHEDMFPSWLSGDDADHLATINDRVATKSYKRQINWIRKNLINKKAGK